MCLLHQSQRPLSSLRLSGVHSGEGMAGVFSYESSEIDWCEDNYRHSEHVVESFNTVNWKVFIQQWRHQPNNCNSKPHFGLVIDLMFPLQMSSFIFFIISPIMLYLLHPYAKERSLAIHLVWVMMIFVGQFFLSLFKPTICLQNKSTKCFVFVKQADSV